MINFKNSDFCKLLRLCAISALQISKKHFATFDFFVKTKLVLTVWVSTSLSKFGYWQGDDCGKFMSKGFFNHQVYDDRIIIPEDLKGL